MLLHLAVTPEVPDTCWISMRILAQCSIIAIVHWEYSYVRRTKFLASCYCILIGFLGRVITCWRAMVSLPFRGILWVIVVWVTMTADQILIVMLLFLLPSSEGSLLKWFISIMIQRYFSLGALQISVSLLHLLEYLPNIAPGLLLDVLRWSRIKLFFLLDDNGQKEQRLDLKLLTKNKDKATKNSIELDFDFSWNNIKLNTAYLKRCRLGDVRGCYQKLIVKFVIPWFVIENEW